MSGICGIWSLDGETAVTAPADAILSELERRGPDGSRLWQGDHVALGHALLATTPEALVEVLPLTDSASGCTITADARLDNRAELLGALGLESEAAQIGDGALILRAYLTWGDDCLRQLIGDFAFAIWDPRAPRFFCGRDHMGMRQLNYCHLPGRLFAFATEPEALFRHPHIIRRHYEARIADYLDNLEGHDLESTFFEGVFRLPPAHCLIVTNRSLSVARYWQVQAPAELILDTDQDYAQAFLAHFTEAVQCRLRSAGPVACMLSGGIDSNAVAAVAARLLVETGIGPLPTYSAVGPDPAACVETDTIREAMTNPDFSPTTINHADMPDMLDPLANQTKNCAEPFDGQMTLLRAVYLAAHRGGAKVVLDGVSADAVLSAGNCLAELFHQRGIKAALAEARAQRRFWGPAFRSRQALFKAGWAVFAPTSLRLLRRELAARTRDLNRHWSNDLIAASFARRVSLPARRQQFRRHGGSGRPFGRQRRECMLRHPHIVAARERYDRVASAVAVEPRDPFLDIRLLEFLLSLPSAQLQGNGWPKLVLRRAMKGLVPSKVIWRRGKSHLGPAFTAAIVDHIDRSGGEQHDQLSIAKPLISPLAKRVVRASLKGNYTDLLDRWRMLEIRILSWWLGRTQYGDDS